MKRALITGITGFAASHLAELLLKEGYEVHGGCRWRSNNENIKHILKDIKVHQLDVTDAHSTKAVVKEVGPDVIFHLAAQSFVPASWKSPAETFNINVGGTINLLEAVRGCGINPIVQLACSSEEYGEVFSNEVPIKEDQPLRPQSPYGVSKVAVDLLGHQYFRSYGIKTIITRAFNHTGPRRPDNFVTSNFAKQVVEVKKKKRKEIQVGNLEAVRDFTDVRDMVKAYLLAVQKCKYGTPYNICTGKGYTIKEMLDKLVWLSKVKVKIVSDPSRMRPSDVPTLIGDNSRFCKETGWKPTTHFDITMHDLLEYWEERV